MSGEVRVTITDCDQPDLIGREWATDDDGNHFTVENLTIDRIRRVNGRRCTRWHDPNTDAWNGADWSNAMMGEIGEMIEAEGHARGAMIAGGRAANITKKLRRHETGTSAPMDPDEQTLRDALGHEIADVLLYALLLADHYGIDVNESIVEKFNSVSEIQGFPERLP